MHRPGVAVAYPLRGAMSALVVDPQPEQVPRLQVGDA
jgi:hypothetical protein